VKFILKAYKAWLLFDNLPESTKTFEF
jgi:hypothetical protein